MKDTLRQQFDRLGMRLQELDARLADPASTADMNKFRELSREQSEASRDRRAVPPLHAARGRPRHRAGDAGRGRRRRRDGGDGARRDRRLRHRPRRSLDAALQATLLPRDPDDARPAFVEIRAGSGGEESALFAADLLRMYLRYAERQGWRSEIMSESPSDLGGYKEVVVRLENPSGARGLAAATDGVYGQLRFESGGHRVQRVPATETQGRVHSSACTVAVLAEPDAAAEVTLNPSELRIDTFRASGAGGQHINKTDSAVRITHLPTGIVAECQDDRSQHRNKAKAMTVLLARLQGRERAEREARDAAERKSLIGSGDSSDRIRTYNFPQGRLTDHRINLTLYKLGAVMEGDLADVVGALRAARAQEQLAALESGA